MYVDAMRFAFMCRERGPSKGRRVAIIGAGVAGLTVAGYLICKGFDVTVFERLPEAGGLALHVIPEMRVSPSRVLKGVEDLEKLGVEIIRGVEVVGGNPPRPEVGEALKRVQLDDVARDYDAIVVSTGTWRSAKLGIPGEDAKNVLSAITLLYGIKAYRIGLVDRPPFTLVGRRVVIVGGGIEALDCAIEAVYEGAREIYILFDGVARESPMGLYAIRSLETRGVRFVELVKPVNIVVEDGMARSIELVKLHPRTREPIPYSVFSIDVDIVVNAKQVLPTPPIEDGYMGVKLDEMGRILVDERHRASDRVYACGDVVTGPSKLGQAIRDALEAALSIESDLSR